MDVNRYPTGSRVDVYWCDVEEWYAATVLKTRTVSHTIAGAKTLCRKILCRFLVLHGKFEFQEFKESSPGAEFLELFVNST